jgi:BA14K-like protein
MRLAVYGAVLVIALGSVLLGLDRLPAPMSPMVDTAAGLAAAPAPPLPTPIAQPASPVPTATPSTTPSATIGAPIVPPALAAPARPAAPATAEAATQAAPVAASEPAARCNVDACTAAYRSFTRSDCTYQPSNGPRRLCTK